MPVIERCCEVLMEDGTWEPGVIVHEAASGRAALIRWRGITSWHYRAGCAPDDPDGPDEWRVPDAR